MSCMKTCVLEECSVEYAKAKCVMSSAAMIKVRDIGKYILSAAKNVTFCN